MLVMRPALCHGCWTPHLSITDLVGVLALITEPELDGSRHRVPLSTEYCTLPYKPGSEAFESCSILEP